MKVKRIAPVMFVVGGHGKTMPFFYNLLGGHPSPVFRDGDHMTMTWIIGESYLEVFRPADPEGMVAKFLNEKGEGIMGVGVQVEDLDEAQAELEKAGYKVEDRVDYPTPGLMIDGVEWHKVAFVRAFGTTFVLGETKDILKK